MAECPGGRTNRGIRSQFRLALPGLGLGKGIYPIHLGEIMDAGQSTQRNIPSSPNKLTRTVREYEEAIEKLTNENFDLKLKLFLYEEKKGPGDKDSVTSNHIQVIVQLKSETESLHNELRTKDELLKDALERADRFESDFKEIEKKYADLQAELSSLSELPSKEIFLSLQDEKENLIKYTETLEKELAEKEEAVQDANQKIEFLGNRIETLEEKIKKRSLAIQGFVYKNYKEKEMLPDELRNIVISATQAAKNKNKDNLAVAIKNITFSLNQMMSTSSLSEEKENIASPPVKCLKKETLEKSSSFLPSHSETATELSHIQSLKEVLTERNTPAMNLDAVIHDSFARGKSLRESDVNISKRVVTDFSAMSPSTERNLISFSNSLSNQVCSTVDHSPINITTMSSGYTNKEKNNSEESDQLMKISDENKRLQDCLNEKLDLITNLHDNCLELELKVADFEKTESDASKENEELKKSLKEKHALIDDLHDTCKELELKLSHLQETENDASDENEKLKRDLQEKLALIQELQTAYKELELKRVDVQGMAHDTFTENEKLKHDLSKQHALIQDLCARLDMKGMHLQNAGFDASRAPNLRSVYTQTDIAGYKLLNEYELTKLQKDAELSNSVEELREDILLLLLAVEDKNKELSAVKQSLSVVQEDLKRALNTSAVIDKDFYESERNELHERLAISCSLNEELMKQLKNLKKFMEDLLQNKFDISVESINEMTISKCLDESLQLSNALSDHLSICEGSKLFEDCESFVYSRVSNPDEKRNFLQALSRSSLPEQDQSYAPGAHILEEYVAYSQSKKIGKESDVSQLFLQCWQHVNNTSHNQSQTSHLVQNNIISRHVGYASSDSDIWSEPDRNVSLQRIGISLQNSPVSSKSPRKLRLKEKRLSSRLSSEQDTSSSELRCTSKKRHASTSRRLSFKETIKNQDFTSEKFYFLLTEKYNKLKGLLDELKNMENGKLSEEVWIRLNTIVASLGGTLQKLLIARDSARDFPSAVCGRCVMLELFSDIKVSHKEADFIIDDSSSEQAILEQFSREIRLLKEACKETFPLFCENTDELENEMARLNYENLNLSDEINNLKKELFKLKQVESDLFHKNEKLLQELSHVNENNCELNKALSDLEQKSKESGFILDNLTAELQKSKAELISMNERCLEYEKQLSEQIHMKKTLETPSLSEDNYIRKIEDLNAEKNCVVQELQNLQEEKTFLEKENTRITNNLQSKISEIISLQETVKKLEDEQKTLNSYSEELQIKLKSALDDLKHLRKKCEEYKEMLTKGKENEVEYSKELEAKFLAEKEKLMSKISLLTNENANINDSLQSKNNELLSLQIELKNKRENVKDLQKKCDEYEKMSTKYKENETEYSRQFEELEAKSLAEKKKLMNEIALLKNENASTNDILQSKNKELLSSQMELKSARENLKILEKKCTDYEAEYSEQLKKLEAGFLSEREKLISEISVLRNENTSIKNSLQSKNNELLSLQIELNSAMENSKNLQKKYKEYEEEVSTKWREYKAEFSEQLKELEAKSLVEKQKLMSKISLLTNENASINDSLQSKNNELLSSHIELNSARENLKNLQEKCKECEEKMLTKCKEYETEYSAQLKQLEAEFLAEKEKLMSEISLLTNENSSVNESLKSKENELLSLQKIMKKHQLAKATLSAHCEDLQTQLKTTKEDLKNYENKCHVYEETIKTLRENEVAYCKHLKENEETSLTENNRLLEEISLLKKERKQILEKLEDEQIRYEKLKTEQMELSENYVKSCAQLVNLKLLNEELKSKQQHLLQRNEFYGNALQSSNNECNILNQDLKCLRDTLQNLESKCLSYEKQLTASAGLKDHLVECLLNINNEFLIHRQKLNEMYKTYGYENYILFDEPPTNESVPAMDEDNIQNLCENISSEAKKLFQSVDMLFGFLKSFHIKSSEPKSPKDKSSIKEQLETQKSENKNFKIQTTHLQCVINDLQNCIAQKEESIQFSAVEIQSLKEKLCHSEQEIERENKLLKKKDDEITMLQERIFNMQTYINSITADKVTLLKNSPRDTEQPDSDSISPNDQLPSHTVSKMCQYTDTALQNTDESVTSGHSLDSSRNSCCEKSLKKLHSLQTKLALCQKRTESLEKENEDLKESFHQQLESKEAKINSTSSKLAELESKLEWKKVRICELKNELLKACNSLIDKDKEMDDLKQKHSECESNLEQKKAFICDLKNELLKTCNSLIDKEKEIDDLEKKLSECETKIKHPKTSVSNRRSMGVPKSIDSNVKTLKQYKWKLIQAIFDIQRKFYEKRGIHLSYCDRFKNHVTNLYSMQLTQSLSKSESLPLLETSLLKEQCEPHDDKLKNLLGLELDIECLENLKIFLNRFFIPDATQTPKTDSKEKVSSDKLSMPIDVAEEKESRLDMTEISRVTFPDDSVAAAFEDPSTLKIFSFDIFASIVSHNLDCVQKFFSSVEKYQWLKNLDLSAEESTDKAEVKLLLLKVFQESKSLQEGLSTLFNLNELIKKYDFVNSLRIPSNITKLDVSDEESVMSEETIAVSRTESPLSFEDVTPLKMTHPNTSQLEGKTLKSAPVGNKVAVIEPFGAKVTAISSSCDSVCQRSHYSSPDLGIESDPNHDSSAPEQKEEGFNKYQRIVLEEQKFLVKPQQRTVFTTSESAGRWSGHKFGETLYAIGNLQHYELLRQEVKESLVAIKSVLSRTGDGLHHIAKYSSPRKTLEFNTLKSIKDTCVHLEVCLKKANDLVNKFWSASCPSEKEWKLLNDENQSLSEQLTTLRIMLQNRENEFKKALEKLEHAQDLKDNMEKKISKKLVKTKKVIRQAELKLLETRCQNFPPVPKYPSDQTTN